MRKSIYIHLVILLGVTIPLVFLTFRYLSKIERKSYDFSREFPYKYMDIKSFDLKYNSYYIAGFFNDTLFLGNYTTAPALLAINQQLKDTQLIVIHLDKSLKPRRANYKIAVDSPHFYMYSGQDRLILRGELNGKWQPRKENVICPYYQECFPVNEASYIFRYVSTNTRENAFRKETPNINRIENEKVLEKQLDGRFCTTGHSLYYKELNLFAYVYLYRNEILLIDTNLQLIKKIKTIDPIDSVRFTVSTINSTNSKVITSLAIRVNLKCASWKHYLFIHSDLMGKGEDDVKFENSTVVDIYDLKKGVYVYSFYLPNPAKRNISQLKIANGYVYTINGNVLSQYHIKLPE